MPEQLKPCPACQEPSAHGGIHENYSNGSVEHFIECWSCDMQGPHCFTEAAAIAAWNSLPRALTWGKEPKLGEWNWWRSGGYRLPRYVYTDGTIDTTMMGRIPWQDVGGEWAGPIQAPAE